MDPQVELYTFTAGASTYRYTSGPEDLLVGGFTFTAAAISRAGIEASDDSSRAGVTISAEHDLGYVVAVLGTYNYGTVIIQAWNGDTEAWDTAWSGRVVNISLSGAEAQIETQSILSVPARLGLYGKYQTMCRHALYGDQCGVAAATYKYEGTVSVVSGYTVTVPGLDGEADDYYTYGYADFGAYGSALITDHAANVITLFCLIPGLIAGASADVYAGCDRLFATCLARFDNALRFGGFPWLPLPSVKGPIYPHRPTKVRR